MHKGADRIMVVRQLATKTPIEVGAKCTLVPLSTKASAVQKIFILNSANERVLRELVFKGDQAKHVF
jgi:hypothetical protein